MGLVVLDGNSLKIDELVDIARHNTKVVVSESSKKQIRKCNTLLLDWARKGKIIYGATTGFGEMCHMLIPPKHEKELQNNLIRSHAANVGSALPTDAVRACMALRINTLAKGYSGVKTQTVDTLTKMLNKGVHPVVPEIGSVGASGDLAPLAHIALVGLGEGEAEYKGEIMKGSQALEKAEIEKFDLSYKEGLALINGTSAMTAMGALLIHDGYSVVKAAEIATALSLEVLKASPKPFDERGHQAKPHPGQLACARNIRALLEGSKLTKNQGELNDALEKELGEDVTDSDKYLQDAYSLRCIPQVLGSVRDALDYAKERIDTEMNSANDNPLIFPDTGDVFHGGAHFHGQPVALPLDVAAIALSTIGVISERRIDRLLDKTHSEGLPSFLIRGAVGLECGFAGTQYTATSIVAENRTLVTPASVQSIPSNGDNQDVVSMGLIAARKARRILDNVAYVIAIELLCGAQAADIRGPEKLGRASKETYRLIRGRVPEMVKDRFMSPDINRVAEIIKTGELVEAVEKAVGKLD